MKNSHKIKMYTLLPNGYVLARQPLKRGSSTWWICLEVAEPCENLFILGKIIWTIVKCP